MSDKQYLSFDQFRKEYTAGEKDKVKKTLLYSLPAAALGTYVGYKYAPGIISAAKKTPTFIRKGLRSVYQAADPSKNFNPKIFQNKMFKKHVGELTEAEIKDIMKGMSGPGLRTAAAGAIVGVGLGAHAGEIHGGLKSMRQAEQEAGYEPSTIRQALGRTAGGAALGTAGGIAGLMAGRGISKLLPAKGFIKGVQYAVPAIILGTAGDAVGNYMTSRYLQKHNKKTP